MKSYDSCEESPGPTPRTFPVTTCVHTLATLAPGQPVTAKDLAICDACRWWQEATAQFKYNLTSTKLRRTMRKKGYRLADSCDNCKHCYRDRMRCYQFKRDFHPTVGHWNICDLYEKRIT